MARSIRSDPRGTNDGDGDLAGFPEVAVVLGGGFSPGGEPSASTTARARTAAHLAQKRPSLAIIASGSHGDGPAPAKSEAAIMADLIAATGVSRDRLFLEDRSRDTIGNAVEVEESVQALQGHGKTVRAANMNTSNAASWRSIA